MPSVTKRTWVTDGQERYSYQVSWVEDGRQHKKAGFKRKKDAESWAAQKQTTIDDGSSRAAAHRICVSEAAGLYLSHVEERRKADLISDGYAHTIKAMFSNYICKEQSWVPPSRTGARPDYASRFHSPIGHKKLIQVRPSTVETLRDDLQKTGMHFRSVRAVIVCLHQFFEYCRKRDLIAVNPAARIKVEVPRQLRDEEVIVPSRTVMHLVLESVSLDFRLMIEFAATTGLRSGEMRALAWADVNFQKPSVKVTRSVDDKGRFGPPKTKGSKREVPISSALAGKLAAHRAASRHTSDSDLVFANGRGKVTGPNILLRRLYRALDRLKQERLYGTAFDTTQFRPGFQQA